MPTPEENKQLARRIPQEVVNQGQIDLLDDLLAKDFVGHYRGRRYDREAFKQYIAARKEAFPDLSVTVEHIVAEENMVAQHVTIQGTHEGGYKGAEPTETEIDVSNMVFSRIEAGKIIERWRVLDELGRLEDIGLLNDWQIRNQYLKVLNRVLRHNLRNDLNAIVGHAELLAEEEDSESAHAETIRKIADRLIDIGDKAHSLEQDAVRKSLKPERLDILAIVEQLAESYRENYPMARISLDTREVIGDLQTDRGLLRRVLTELVENALKHNDERHPEVRIEVNRADPAPGPVRIRIEDNGPGIPDHEIEPIEREGETPLIHGSGVGLWAVKWGIERLDGTLTFEANEPRGGVVEIRLPELVLSQ